MKGLAGCAGGPTSANVGNQVTNTLGLEELGEQRGPERLNLNAGSLGKGVDVVGLFQAGTNP